MTNGPKEGEAPQYSYYDYMMFVAFPFVKMLGVPATQPLAKISAEQVLSILKGKRPLNFIQASQNIYRDQGGMSGFYKGTIPSMFREGYKTSYKGALQIQAISLANSYIPSDVYGGHFGRGLFAGVYSGLIDSILSVYIERYKTFALTQTEKTNFFQYLCKIHAEEKVKHNSNPKVAFGMMMEMAAGFRVTAIKQVSMAGAFFTAKELADAYAVPHKVEYPIATMIFTTLAPAVAAAAIGAPAETLKTLIQKQTGQKQKLSSLLKTVVAKAGYRGLAAGLGTRFVLVTFGYGINAAFLKVYDNLKSKPPVPPSRVDDAILNELTDKMQKLEVELGSQPNNVIEEVDQLADHLQQFRLGERTDRVIMDHSDETSDMSEGLSLQNNLTSKLRM